MCWLAGAVQAGALETALSCLDAGPDATVNAALAVEPNEHTSFHEPLENAKAEECVGLQVRSKLVLLRQH